MTASLDYFWYTSGDPPDYPSGYLANMGVYVDIVNNYYRVRSYFDGTLDYDSGDYNIGLSGSGEYPDLTGDLWVAAEDWSTHTVKWSIDPDPAGGGVFVESPERDCTRWGSIPAKATNPTPADGSGPGIDFSDWTLSWDPAGLTEWYTVRAGLSPSSLFIISQSQSDTTLVVDPTYRDAISGGTVYWRVDSEATGYVTTEGDVWSFDPRPSKVTIPTPANGATNVSLNTDTLSWTAATGTSDGYHVYMSWWGGASTLYTTQTSVDLSEWTPLYMDRFTYAHTYTWRVDSVKTGYDDVTGDTWTFETIDKTLSLRLFNIPSDLSREES